MVDLLSLDQKDLEVLMRENGYPADRGRQLLSWLFEKRVTKIDKMTNLPVPLRTWLEKHAAAALPAVVARRTAADGETVKFLLRYDDKTAVETVLMLYEREESRRRNTVCVSTQAGCAMGCAFCASTLNGLARNLTAGEIVSQLLVADRHLREEKRTGITNLVYMGMGEPLANWKAVRKSIAIAHRGFGIGMRRITVSTCGLVPMIYEIADPETPFTLAVSLHAPTDALRSRLMPVNRRYPIASLMAAVDHYIERTNRRVTIEYALFRNVNDAAGSELAALLKGRLVHVNLILANPVPESPLQPAGIDRAKAFAAALAAAGVPHSLRESKGGDIDAACGQLRRGFRGDRAEIAAEKGE